MAALRSALTEFQESCVSLRGNRVTGRKVKVDRYRELPPPKLTPPPPFNFPSPLNLLPPLPLQEAAKKLLTLLENAELCRALDFATRAVPPGSTGEEGWAMYCPEVSSPADDPCALLPSPSSFRAPATLKRPYSGARAHSIP